MALFEDLAKGELLSGDVLGGLAIGAVALVAMPLVAPLLRPIAKTAVKAGILTHNGAKALYDQAANGLTELACRSAARSERDRLDGVSTTSRPSYNRRAA